MSFRRILFLIFGSKEKLDILERIIELAQSLKALIIALNVIDFNTVRNLSLQLNKREAEIMVDLEEDGWKYLYHLEDLAKERQVKIFILQEEGILESEVFKACRKFNPDLLIIPKHVEWGIHSYIKFVEDLIKKIEVPILLI